MKSDFKKFISTRWLRGFLILAIVYFSQVYPYYHLHHDHGGGLFEFEISAHPIDVEVDHGSHHHHHDDEGQKNDHHSKFEKYIDWYVTRAQSPDKISAINLEFKLVDIVEEEKSAFSIHYLVPPRLNQYDNLSYSLRGPPSFCS